MAWVRPAGSLPGRGAGVVHWVLLVLAVAVSASACGTLKALAGEPTGDHTPWLGLVDTDGTHYPAEHAAGFQLVTIALSWSQAQPHRDDFQAAYGRTIRARIAAARAQHLAVIVDPGLQFPPSWVFALPGGTRFVDQYGDVFSGPRASGNDVANGVTNPAVRDAMGHYLDWLGAQLPKGQVWGVRQGGGPLGELRYPAGNAVGHPDSWWAYDASTQARSPVPGWKPGTGTADQAQQFLSAYNGALTQFGRWLNDRFRRDFATRSLLMLPGWGERPGVSAAAVASRLTKAPEEFHEGLDWQTLLGSLPDARHTVAYTTFLDAQQVQPTAQLEDPAHYLASLVQVDHLTLGGENTGTASAASLHLSLLRARQLGFVVVNWMDERRLLSPRDTQPSLATVSSQTRTVLRGSP